MLVIEIGDFKALMNTFLSINLPLGVEILNTSGSKVELKSISLALYLLHLSSSLTFYVSSILYSYEHNPPCLIIAFSIISEGSVIQSFSSTTKDPLLNP